MVSIALRVFGTAASGHALSVKLLSVTVQFLCDRCEDTVSCKIRFVPVGTTYIVCLEQVLHRSTTAARTLADLESYLLDALRRLMVL